MPKVSFWICTGKYVLYGQILCRRYCSVSDYSSLTLCGVCDYSQTPVPQTPVPQTLWSLTVSVTLAPRLLEASGPALFASCYSPIWFDKFSYWDRASWVTYLNSILYGTHTSISRFFSIGAYEYLSFITKMIPPIFLFNEGSMQVFSSRNLLLLQMKQRGMDETDAENGASAWNVTTRWHGGS